MSAAAHEPGRAALPASYFESMYEHSDDPWGFADRWYEWRKRAITMASLPRARFESGFEPGCSGGWLTAELATRCDRLLATDVSPRAAAAASDRLADARHVEVREAQVPQDWPGGRFDLIIVSEIAYYLDRSGAALIGERARSSLTDDGVVVICHWRHAVSDYPLAGDEAQRLVVEGAGLAPLARHVEEDFLLDVLAGPGVVSVARAEGLVGA